MDERGSESGGAGPSGTPHENTPKKPVVVLVIGMAGSGKTTLMQRLNSELHRLKKPGYIINLDPATHSLPYAPNIDIRDTVKYKEVMKQYGLGPNGGILTSCNLFATKFDQVMKLCEKERDPPLQYVLVDTPGQIEIFSWSASGAIITELFASTFQTVVAFVVDTVKCSKPQVFMANMLQACSIYYKMKLPLLVVFNKCDVADSGFALSWMEDYDEFDAALSKDSSYAATLSRSLALVLEKFYRNLNTVGISAVTGQGMDEFFKAVGKCAQEYDETYKPELEQRLRAKQEEEVERARKEMAKLKSDMSASQGQGASA